MIIGHTNRVEKCSRFPGPTSRAWPTTERVHDYRRESPSFLAKIFNWDGFKSSKIQFLTDCFEPIRLGLRWTNADLNDNKRFNVDIYFEIQGQQVELLQLPLSIEGRIPSFFADYIARCIFNCALFGHPYGLNGEYIPAGRTGLMIASPTIVSQLFELRGKSKPEMSFPLPTTRFLQTLATRSGIPPIKTESSEIADWLGT